MLPLWLVAGCDSFDIVRQYLTWTVVDNTGSLLLDGIALQQKAKLSFWDALVIQASISSGCEPPS